MELVPCDAGSSQEGLQAAQGDCGVSADIPSPPGHVPVLLLQVTQAWQGAWTGRSPEVPSNPNKSVIW